MKLKLLTTGLLSIAVTLGASTVKEVRANSEAEFICADSYDGESEQSLPTTFAWTPHGKVAIIRWETEDFLNAGFSPQERCEAVSPRFQEAYDNNTLGLITNGQMNARPVICTSNESGGECVTLLMTLRPEDNSLRVLQSLKQILNMEQVGPIKHSSGIPQVYYEVDIENFLETAPVEQN